MKNNNLSAEIQSLTHQLTAVSDTPRLDAELLAADILQRSRAWLFAHGEETLTAQQRQQLQNLSVRRMAGEPIAYILGHKEFWGFTLQITPAVLTPRPETEHLVEWILANFPADSRLDLADLGTGSGAIALALATERPQWRIAATDQSAAALAVAKQNAAQHSLSHVHFYLGDWCAALPQKNYAVLVSNPPYIAAGDLHLQRLTHEPMSALSSGPDGLDAIRHIIAQAPDYLAPSGYLVLEHGHDQASAIIHLLEQRGFTAIQSHRDLAHHPRFVTARRPSIT